MPRLIPPKSLPGRPKILGLKKQIKFTNSLLERINQFRIYTKNKTNINPSFNDSVRSLIDKGLTELKIYELEDDEEDSG